MLKELNWLLSMHEAGVIDRRQLLSALLTTCASGRSPFPAGSGASLRRGRTLNHVTLSVSQLAHSLTFYEQLLGIRFTSARPGQATGKLENGALVLDTYPDSARPDHPRGIDHFCIGLDVYQPQRTLAELRRQFPTALVSLEGRRGDQVYIRDPDGARVQLCAADYRP